MSMATGAISGNRMTGNMQKNKIPKGYEHGQLGQFTPEQMQLFQSMFGQLGPDSFLGKLASGDQSQFEQLEAPAWRQFQEAQGGLASRFSGAGMGGRHSSGFQNAANQQSMDFASQLQSQRMGLQQQALESLMGMSNTLLQQRPYEQFLTPKKTPFWQSLLQSGVGGLAQGFGSGFGGKAFTGMFG